MPSIKLHAHMAHAGVASRRASEELIATGKVKVNGEVAHIGQRIDPNTDVVTINGKKISGNEKHRYFLVYKPRGYVSTTSDDMGRKDVLSLLPPLEERLYPVGRLDQDSEGLMILTNDGDFAHKMTHPSFKVPKTYHATVAGRPTYKALHLLQEGVKLSEGFTRPDRFSVLEEREYDTVIEMTIHQGYNRQVRRMFERIGYDVIRLVRVSLGNFNLEQLNGKKYIEIPSEDIKKAYQ